VYFSSRHNLEPYLPQQQHHRQQSHLHQTQQQHHHHQQLIIIIIIIIMNNNGSDDEMTTEHLMLVCTLEWLDAELSEAREAYKNLLSEHIREQRRLNRSLPIAKSRPSWESFCDKTTDQHFRRMFRMPKESFKLLCSKISSTIGIDTFRPEGGIVDGPNAAMLRDVGGYIVGEVKVAISLRMLAGGSYLDLVPLFGVGKAALYFIFDNFLHWILTTFSFPLPKMIRQNDWESLTALSDQFAERSNGVFHGVFGALDGIAIRIKSPRESEVSDPKNFYCRKGFFALNVQAISDKSKRFLWAYTSSKGSTHDSAAFSNSRLFTHLEQKAQLAERQLFIVGDSAYNLSSFLLVPYDSNEVQNDETKAKDAFNYYLSSCRVVIECSFGELVSRWGILWRTLQFNVSKSQKVVQTCMLIHNFIVETRDEEDVNIFFQNATEIYDEEQRGLTEATGELPTPLVTDNDEPRPSGRPSAIETQHRQQGMEMRHKLTISLAVNGLERPLYNGMRYNSFGHIVFDK
jgi:hypothetical protein